MIQRSAIVAGICAAMIAVHLVDLVLGGVLSRFGIHPRDPGSAWTIVTAPWLHGDFAHLFSNLAAFVVLAALCLVNGIRYFVKASALIIAIGGALVWLLGRDANHIGASGWIFGLWSLVIALAWYDRSLRNIAIAGAVLIVYGGSMVIGLLPTDSRISFEGHVFGAIAGVIAAALLSKQQRRIATPARANGELKFWS